MELVCSVCNKRFDFSEKEIAYFKKRGWRSIPKRCKECRDADVSVKLGLRSSSFFENAQVFGMPFPVAGGTDVWRSYEIEVIILGETKYVSYSEEKNIYFLTSNRKEASHFFEEHAKKIMEVYKEKIPYKAQFNLISYGHYERLRCY